MSTLTREEIIWRIKSVSKKRRELGLDLYGVNLSGANLEGAYLAGVGLEAATLNHANFVEADFRDADLEDAVIEYANLMAADLRGAGLTGSKLNGSNLSGANLGGAKLDDAKIFNADLIGANLTNADLSYSDFFRSNFFWADLRGASLWYTDLTEVDLRWADLTGASLVGTRFINTKLAGANFTEAIIDSTIFGFTDLSKVIGLESVIPMGESVVDINVLYRTKGAISDEFLKKAGIPQPIINWHRGLKVKPIVFVAYSRADDEEKELVLKHLRGLQEAELIELWTDNDIAPGANWEEEIENVISLARVAILLISPDFLASDFITSFEIPKILKRRNESKFTIFPVLIKPCIWDAHGWLRKLQMRPKSLQPIWGSGSDLIDRNLSDLTGEIRDIVQNIR